MTHGDDGGNLTAPRHLVLTLIYDKVNCILDDLYQPC